MNERKELIRWVKKHRKQLIIAGISVGALFLIILGIRNRKTIVAIWSSLREAVLRAPAKTAETAVRVTVDPPIVPAREVVTTIASNSETLPFEVRRHIRNLPAGWHASPVKVAEASANNIILMDGQTWVDTYMKGCAAA